MLICNEHWGRNGRLRKATQLRKDFKKRAAAAEWCGRWVWLRSGREQEIAPWHVSELEARASVYEPGGDGKGKYFLNIILY